MLCNLISNFQILIDFFFVLVDFKSQNHSCDVYIESKTAVTVIKIHISFNNRVTHINQIYIYDNENGSSNS